MTRGRRGEPLFVLVLNPVRPVWGILVRVLETNETGALGGIECEYECAYKYEWVACKDRNECRSSHPFRFG